MPVLACGPRRPPFFCLLLLVGWVLTAPARAQERPALPPVLLPGGATDSLILLGRPCAPAGRRILVGQIAFFGNAKTKDRILRAELDFQEGDSVEVADLKAHLESCRRRLYNLQLFHAVTGQTSCRDGRLLIVFTVRERWYLFPSPIFSLADRNVRAWLDKHDFARVDYGLHLVQRNFRGRNESVTLNLQHGFNRKYEVFYNLPFALSRQHGLGLVFDASLYQSHNLEVTTVADRPQSFRSEAAFPIRRWYVGAGVLKWHNVERQSRFEVLYSHERVTDSVLRRQPLYFGPAVTPARRAWLEARFTHTVNHTNAFAYPLTGHGWEVLLTPRVGVAGAPQLAVQAQAGYRHYAALGHDFYYAVGLKGQVRFTRTIAYADNLALGYRTSVRGYDLYVMNGQHFAVLRQGLTRRLFDVERLPLPTRRGTRFGDVPLAAYLNLFADAAYVRDASSLATSNPLTNRPLAAVGLGLHVVSYYDRVYVIEGALNHRGQTSLVISAGFPI